MTSAWVGFEGLPDGPFALLQPDELIVAHALSEVLPALARVESAVRAGATAVGMLAYEAAPAFDAAMCVQLPLAGMPLLHFAVCHGGRGGTGVVRHAGWDDAEVRRGVRAALPPVASCTAPEFGVTLPPASPAPSSPASGASFPPASGVSSPPASGAPLPAFTVSALTPDASRESYNEALAAIKRAIREGDTYQVNYTLRLHARVAGDAGALLASLLRAQRCGYGAFLDLGAGGLLLSASPELFFSWRESEGALRARPMKGTAPRGLGAADDAAAAARLAACPKNRAENLMIVDLLRNDLARLAAVGSVRVPRLFAVERYPTVLQMTSDVCAETRPGTRLLEVLSALFPCGSITGAPKLSTMRLIAALEGAPRGAYCGAILAITPERRQGGGASAGGGGGGASEGGGGGGASPFSLRVVASVPIRTLHIRDPACGAAQYGCGGGITWDSTSQGEYEELLAKAEVLRVASQGGAQGGAQDGAQAPDVRSADCSLGQACGRDAPDFELLETLRMDLLSEPPAQAQAQGAEAPEAEAEALPLEGGLPASEGAPPAAGAALAARGRCWGARFFLLPAHLARLRASALYFGFAFPGEARVQAALAGAARELVEGAAREPLEGAAREPFEGAREPLEGAAREPLEGAREPLAGPAASRLAGPWRARLLLHREGGLRVELSRPPSTLPAAAPDFACCPPAAAAGAGDALPACAVSPVPASPSNVFLRHKTTHRAVYEAHLAGVRALSAAAAPAAPSAAAAPAAPPPQPLDASASAPAAPGRQLLDVLLWVSAGPAGPALASEFTLGSAVFELPCGRRLTPRLSTGCLPGTARAAALHAGALEEADITLDEARAAKAVWLLNSLRGWVQVRLV